MPDHEKMYHIMFNAATEVEQIACEVAEYLRQSQQLAYQASDILRKAHQDCEELYIGEEQEKSGD